jgi:hypothetical protein
MNKKIIFAIIAVSFLIAGCGKINSTNNVQQNVNSDTTQSTSKSETTKSTTTSDSTSDSTSTIDYTQYIKKNWVRNGDINSSSNGNLSILISKIENGKIYGNITAVGSSPAYNMDSSKFEGNINNDTAKCTLLDDSRGNEGNIELLFKSKNSLQAKITITKKSNDNIMRIPEGTFEFTPYNLKDINGLKIIENQTFTVNLNSWGNVKFVSGKLTSGSHIPLVFYLTDEDGNILYTFDVNLPYSIDIEAVSFKDLNKDGLKDIIIIASDTYDGAPKTEIATVYFQNADGSFKNDSNLDKEINSSGNNKTVTDVTNYVSNKF